MDTVVATAVAQYQSEPSEVSDQQQLDWGRLLCSAVKGCGISEVKVNSLHDSTQNYDTYS